MKNFFYLYDNQRLEQVVQSSCGVSTSTFADIQNPARQSPEEPALADPALRCTEMRGCTRWSLMESSDFKYYVNL